MINVTWKTWIRGLNTLQSPTNIRDDELAVATNIVLTDEGQPVRRPGTDYFGDTLNATNTPMLIPHYNKSGVNTLMAIRDGIGALRNDTSGAWATISSNASWPSSTRYNWAMLNNVTYITSNAEALTKFDGTYLTRFTTISTPTGLSVARGASLASGNITLSYKISAENTYGETAASSAATVQVNRNRSDWNFDSTAPNSNYSTTLTWSASSGATKYNIYGVESGFETYLDTVEGGGLSYVDYGIKTPSTLFAAPTSNTTDAPRGEYIKTYKSALIIAGDTSEPSRVYYSAGVDKPDSFTISDGGGWVDVNKNADDGVIVGLGIYQDSLIIFKEFSIWKFDFTTSAIPSLTNIRQGVGAISHKTIIPVENDLFFMGKSIGGTPAIYVLGNEPNFLNVLRTNELSARVRPEFTLIATSYNRTAAVYANNKYHVFYTDGSGTRNNLGIVYDRQRLGFTKWQDIYVENPLVWRNTSNIEKLIYADGMDKRVSEISENFSTDKTIPIEWEIRTKQYEGKSVSQYERTKWANFVLKDAEGEINFKFYHDDNVTSLTQSAQNRSRNTAFGYWSFGTGHFGTTGVETSGSSSPLTRRKFPLHYYGQNSISTSFGIGLSGTNSSSRATLLSVEFQRKELSKNYRELDDVYQI